MIRARNLRVGAVFLAASATLAACASAPVHYYTLVAQADQSRVSAAADPAAIQFELLSIGVPAEVDQPQLVVREGGERVDLLDGERWIAPLSDEVHTALAADLARALPGQDVSALGAGGKPVLRLKLDLRRFESVPGAYALIEAAWSLRRLNNGASSDGTPTATCTTSVKETVGPGYDALVEGHQRALHRLAAEIAATALPYLAGQTVQCP
jgi:uncharacterized protein